MRAIAGLLGPRGSGRRRLACALAIAAGAAATIATGAALLVALWVARPLPPGLAEPGGVPSLVIEDRHGVVLRTTRAEDGSRGGWVPLAEVSPAVLQAFLAAEDHRFFEHRGVDLRAVARAARDNLRAGRVVSGASTITMQTARLLLHTPRTWRGKAVQALWALRLERHLDKTTILEQYLNRVPLGQGAVGVAAGAALYFGADARELAVGEAALLAALAHAPSRENPIASPERARAGRLRVLGRMASLGHISVDDAARAAAEPVLRRGARNAFLAPHFTTRVILEGERTGSAPTGTIRTTLDLDLQRALEAEVRHAVGVLSDRNVRQGAVVVLDNPTGEVLAWVGSPDFWAEGDGQVDMVVSARQPGSVLKPFLYGLAFDRGVTAATVLPDVPRTYTTATGPYQPRNYDRRFWGPVRARIALASSLNVPSVELADRFGAGALLSTLHAAGFSSLTRSAEHYGLGLALGNGEVTLLEVANGFRGLANGGVWSPVRWVAEPGAGSPDDRRERFLSPGAAALLLDILSDADARIPGFGEETPFDFAFPAAAKTGTSRHFTDNWAVVVTGRFTVAVWVGNFSGQPMQGVSGVSGAGPLVYRATLEVARRYPPGALPTPEGAGLTATPVCALSGLLATAECAPVVEWFLPGTEPIHPDDWVRGGRVTLPPEYAEWAAERGSDLMAQPEAARLAAVRPASAKSTGTHTATAASEPPHRILSPLDGDIYEVPVGVDARYATIPLIATGGGGGEGRVRWFVDGREVHAVRWRLELGEHLIRAEWGAGVADSVRIVVR